MAHMWKLEANFMETVLSLHLFLDSGDRAQVIRLVLLLAEPTSGPSPDFEFMIVSATSCVRCGAGDDALTAAGVPVSKGTKLR